MGNIVDDRRWRNLMMRCPRYTGPALKDLAVRYQMSLTAVGHSYPERVFPRRLLARAAACFFDNEAEWLEARNNDMRKELARNERRLVKLRKMESV